MILNYRIKNYKLMLLGLMLTALLAKLGFWQLARFHEKKALIALFENRIHSAPLTASQLTSTKHATFYQATLTGQFDNEHTFLLDNKITNGKIGYEIYTPLYVRTLKAFILVDRGFTPIIGSRNTTPTVPALIGNQSVTGLLNKSPRYVSLGEMKATRTLTWPLRIEYIDLDQIRLLLNKPFYPLILQLQPLSSSDDQIKWQAVAMPPEKHMAYAFQWFALSITLLILSLSLGVGRRDYKYSIKRGV